MADIKFPSEVPSLSPVTNDTVLLTAKDGLINKVTVADVASKTAELVQVDGGAIPAIQGGSTVAAAVELPAGPVGQNRWFDASWGYWKYNNIVLTNPNGAQGIPDGSEGVLFWNGTTQAWSISKVQALPMPQGVNVINPMGNALPNEKAVADYVSPINEKIDDVTRKSTNMFNGVYKRIYQGTATNGTNQIRTNDGGGAVVSTYRTIVLKIEASKTITINVLGTKGVDFDIFPVSIMYTEPNYLINTVQNADETLRQRVSSSSDNPKLTYTNTKTTDVWLLATVSAVSREPKVMINEGFDFLDWEDGSKVYLDLKDIDTGGGTLIQGKKIAFETQGLDDYYDPIFNDSFSNNGLPIPAGLPTIVEFYALYDNLMALAPAGLITKKILTTSVPSSIGDLPIYAYEFNVGNADVRGTEKANYPKLMVSSLIHGGERTAALSLFLLLKQMVTNWQSNKFLEFLRFNINFCIIPAINPSGWHTGDRKNFNKVDLNRNFNLGWTFVSDINSTTYAGLAPLDQIESQVVDAYMKTFKDNIFLAIDYHNFGGTPTTTDGKGFYMSYITTHIDNKLTLQVMKQANSLFSRKMQQQDTRVNQDYNFQLAYADTSSGSGLCRDQYKIYGATQSVTYECHQDWLYTPLSDEQRFDNFNLKIAVKGFANFLRLFIKYGIDNYNISGIK